MISQFIYNIYIHLCHRVIPIVPKKIMVGSAGSAHSKIIPSLLKLTNSTSEIVSICMDSNRCLIITSNTFIIQRCNRDDT